MGEHNTARAYSDGLGAGGDQANEDFRAGPRKVGQAVMLRQPVPPVAQGFGQRGQLDSFPESVRGGAARSHRRLVHYAQNQPGCHWPPRSWRSFTGPFRRSRFVEAHSETGAAAVLTIQPRLCAELAVAFVNDTVPYLVITLNISKSPAPIRPQIGKVSTQAYTIPWATPQRTADNRRVEPIPKMVEVMT